ncbi:MAG: hypothetical protein MSB80_03840, partial [Alphaproteobacteria bacterium]|nr:hypothetical protein [Alphaproteobacteria bacterium]
MKKSLLLSTALVAVFAATQANAFEVKEDVDLNTIFKDGIVKENIWSQTGKTGTLTVDNISMSVNGTGVYANNKSSTINLGNRNGSLQITSNSNMSVFANNEGEIALKGKNIYVKSALSTILAIEGGKVNIDGDTVGITSEAKNEYGILALARGEIDVKAKSIDVTSGYAAIHAGNNTTDSKGPFAAINLVGDNVNLLSTAEDGYAVGAMSQGVVNIDGNTSIKAKEALLARGNSQININKSGKNTVKMDGNIDFDYNKPTSNTGINAYIDVTLNGADSYWTGNTVISYDQKPAADKLEIKSATINLKDGATWNATAI